MRLLPFYSGYAALLLSDTALASWTGRSENLVATRGYKSDKGCSFTLSSSGSFACPAGQLPDGQIRLNGSESTATFYINQSGGITDSKGFGCIVTEPPTTQVQCDQGKPPVQGFSIDASNNLLYKGSPNFFACPATDTEYNVYVSPSFGQKKCFAVTLQASRCGAAASSCPAPGPASTVWQTTTVTEATRQTVTVVTTVPASSCASAGTSALPSTNSTWTWTSTACHHCTKTGYSTGGGGTPAA